MIPQFDVAVTVMVDYETLLPPTSVSGGGTAGFNGEHVDLTATSWQYAINALAVESERLTDADAASSNPDEFEDFLDDMHLEDPGILFDELEGLDVGVAGLVLVLSAAGYLPWISCSAHPGGSKYPQVGLYCSEPRARLLAYAAETVHCGLASQDGGLWLFATSVGVMNRLGCAVLDLRHELDILAPERWTRADGPT